jgi:hypothetical protein
MKAGTKATDSSEDREAYIPVRKSDLLRTLSERNEADAAPFTEFSRVLGAILHYEYFDRLERLRDDYYYFNPDLDLHEYFEQATMEAAYADMSRLLGEVLRGANFVEISHEEIERAHCERPILRVALKTAPEDFRDVRFFSRGRHREKFIVREWFGLRRREIEADVFDNVILVVAAKPLGEMHDKKQMKRYARSKIRPGSVLIKFFRHIAEPDLHSLFPNVRVVLNMRDKIVLGVPALAIGVPLLVNIVPTLSVLFLVLGFYLGITGAVSGDDHRKAFAALSGLVGIGGFLFQQWVRYQRQELMYHKTVADNVYFRNIANNGGIFDYIVGSAEQQEWREVLLGYYFLHTAKAPLTKDELDARIEAWLKERFRIDVDFEADDAVTKLERLGLLKRDGEKLSVLTLQASLECMDEMWDNIFKHGTHTNKKVNWV